MEKNQDPGLGAGSLLSLELLQTVFDFLAFRHVATSCSSVCRHWRAAAEDPHFWYRCFAKWQQRCIELPARQKVQLFPWPQLRKAGIFSLDDLHFVETVPWKHVFLKSFYSKSISINEEPANILGHPAFAFDIIAHTDVTVKRLPFHSKIDESSPLEVRLFYNRNGLSNHEHSFRGWRPLPPKSVFRLSDGEQMEESKAVRFTIPETTGGGEASSLNVKLSKGSTTAVYIQTNQSAGICLTPSKHQIGEVHAAGPHLSICAGFHYASLLPFANARKGEAYEFVGRIEYEPILAKE
ncbi:hypothetical protein QOT17_016761 [Balamuthia mandrillaris]